MRRVVFLHPEPLEAELFRELLMSALLERRGADAHCPNTRHLCEHLDEYFYSLSSPRQALALLAEGDSEGRTGREVLLVSASMPGWQDFCCDLPHRVVLLSGRNDPREARDAAECGALYRRLPNSVGGLYELLQEIQQLARWDAPRELGSAARRQSA